MTIKHKHLIRMYRIHPGEINVRIYITSFDLPESSNQARFRLHDAVPTFRNMKLN